MEAHAQMHMGSLGTVHCLVDEGRTDAQQLSDLTTLLNLPRTPTLGPEPDLRDSRLVHSCSKCPARFLCEKELRIHLRYHSAELAYSCQWCSYAARQPTHLQAHQKAHSSEYQDRTRYLLSMYGHSQRYAPPNTACVEANGEKNSIAWIVVEVASSSQTFAPDATDHKNGTQVFTCAKCPARYFKLDALEYHMTLHGSNNRFKCAECDYSSKTAQNLMKHQVVHRRHLESSEPSRPLPPPDPQFGVSMRGNPNFVYPGCLRNGRMKEKRYKCHKCPSAFEKREQYRVHLTLHGAKQRYRCETCDYSVKYYANYAQHVKKHQANALAQASRRQFETENEIVVDESTPDEVASKNGRKSTISPHGTTPNIPNQDKQAILLTQKKAAGTAREEINKLIRCTECPFSGSDKDIVDAHKRRHGIERLTPPCPHCNYVPRKDENIGEHIRLHFTRLYKPESYLIVELLSLRMRPLFGEKNKEEEEFFRECGDGKFLPVDTNVLSIAPANGYQEKVIVDPNTGETQHRIPNNSTVR